ncbi:hypothetical protein QWZ13_18005 [Reinekea marina]|nr:hypothetical protein [Reinekea marina]MDN3650804.1 hypothetical protein [Reinekea marina]
MAGTGPLKTACASGLRLNTVRASTTTLLCRRGIFNTKWHYVVIVF